MRALLSEAQALLEQGNIEAWYEASQAFHDAIIDSAENRQLKALYKLLKLSMRRYQLMVIGLPRHPDRSQTEHQQIFDAFARGDSDQACTLLRAHLKVRNVLRRAAWRPGRPPDRGRVADVSSREGSASDDARSEEPGARSGVAGPCRDGWRQRSMFSPQ
jgi:DNA-binding GntR family transcriptional regulator